MNTLENEKFLAKASFRLHSTYLSSDFVPDMQIKDRRGIYRKFYYILWDYVPYFDNSVLKWAGKKIADIALSYRAEVILGLESSGIAIAASAAVQGGFMFGFVRKNTKPYGLGKYVEGEFGGKKKVILVDNFTATGASLVRAVEVCKKEGLKVVRCVSVDYFDKLKKVEGFEKLPFTSLSKNSLKIEEMVKMGYFPGNLSFYVKEFVNKPEVFLEPSHIHDKFVKEIDRHKNLKYVIY